MVRGSHPGADRKTGEGDLAVFAFPPESVPDLRGTGTGIKNKKQHMKKVWINQKNF